MGIRLRKSGPPEKGNDDMDDIIIRKVREHPDMADAAARWFHEKWGIPLEAYQESIGECLKKQDPIPQWYLAMDGEGIVGGLGVIENDFHDRKDLARSAAGASPEHCWRPSAKTWRPRASPLCTCSPTTTPSTRGAAGSSTAWCRGTESQICRGCMCTGRKLPDNTR